MEKDFNRVINLLKNYKDEIRPQKKVLENILSYLPEAEPVTKDNFKRYNYSMWWKILLPVGALAVVLIALVYFRGAKAPIIPFGQETQNQAGVPTGNVTSQNADQVLLETNRAIDTTMNEVDVDFQNFDQVNQSQDTSDNNSL